MQRIILNELYVQNFLSIGENGLTVQLDDVKSTLIIGENGAGKTTILEAVTFALYNRTYRKLTQDQIVNSVLQKDCIVKLKFTVGNEKYLVIRTLKGSNGVGNDMTMYEMNKKSGEYQEMPKLVGNGNQERLERLFGIKFNVYKQLIVLGTSGYEEFMKLPTAERRKLIENILGLDLIGIMDEENKGVVKNLNLNLDQLVSQISSLENEMTRGAELVKRIQLTNQENKEKLETTKQSYENLKKDYESAVESRIKAEQRLASLPVLSSPVKEPAVTVSQENLSKLKAVVDMIRDNTSKVDAEIQTHTNVLTALQRDVTIFKSVIDRYKAGGKCPSCNQQLSEHDEEPKNIQNAIDEKNNLIEIEKVAISELKTKRQVLQDKLKDVDVKKMELQKRTDEENSQINARNMEAMESYRLQNQDRIIASNDLKSIENEESRLKSYISSVQNDIKNLEETLQKSNDQNMDYYDDIPQKIEKLNKEKEDILVDIMQRSLITNILKDNGVRSDIIDRYIPLFNESVQKYLDILGADYLFQVNSKFKETILSRGREKFTYDSFSRGEQARIDLAILFSWRDIISKVSGFDMSVLFLDEVFDSSTDTKGVTHLKRLLKYTQDDQIIFSISHRDHNPDDFDSIIRVAKKGRFSEYEREYNNS